VIASAISAYVDDCPEKGIFRINTDAFSDPKLLDLEYKHIFERTWSFLGIESQISRNHDYLTGQIGRTPVLVMRDAEGRIGAYLNLCRHKGARLCWKERGNARFHHCQYHGWGYSSAGKIASIKDRESGRYGAGFDADAHDLVPLARFSSYKGMMFGSLSADVPDLESFLGDMRGYIDLAMDQGAQGMEVIPGRTSYTYAGNWKLQMDNGTDHYHLTSTHTSFLDVQAKRAGKDLARGLRQYDWEKRAVQESGVNLFPHGHTAVWLNQPEPERRPIYPTIGEVRGRVGEASADWMLKLRNVNIFPNVQIAESTALLLRTFRPLAVDRTEMRVYCLAPIGESRESRAGRIRQYEDFFNPSGMATPDDAVLYEECQNSFKAEQGVWLQGYSRGMGAIRTRDEGVVAPPDTRPVAGFTGPFKIQNEVCFHPTWREWARLLGAGVSAGNS